METSVVVTEFMKLAVESGSHVDSLGVVIAVSI